MLAQLVEYGVIEVHLEVDLEAVERHQFGPLVAVLDLDRALDADETLPV